MRVIPMRDMDDLRRYVLEHGTTDLILDVEPWLVHWSEPAEALVPRVARWHNPALPQCTVRLCTNSTRFRSLDVPVRVINAARKPRTARCHLDRLGERPLVAGDLLLLDGLLARRVPADFAWLQWRGVSPPWPRALRVADRLAASLLLVGR